MGKRVISEARQKNWERSWRLGGISWSQIKLKELEVRQGPKYRSGEQCPKGAEGAAREIPETSFACLGAVAGAGLVRPETNLTESHPIQCLDILATTILIKFSLNLRTERELLPITMQTCPAVGRVLGSEWGWRQPALASYVAVVSNVSELRSLCWQDRAYDTFCIVIRNRESGRRQWIHGVCRCKMLYGRKEALGVTIMLSPLECDSSPENVLNMN